MRFSIIVPLYNRPEEIKELLDSFTKQDYFAKNGTFGCEIIIVEDGSKVPSDKIMEIFLEKLPIKYLTKENGGPASARNFAAERSEGEWLIFLDSDTVLPEGWLSAVDAATKENIDAFGGADSAREDFTPVQKAINYSMTSLFTTGGIRGNKKSAEKFHPRSFNMGVRRELFEKLGGFSAMRFGEDIDLSIRIFESGARCVFVPDGWVYHKRRVDFKKFYRQVKASGAARIALSRRHKGSLKLVHLMPTAFTLYLFAALIVAPLCYWVLTPLALWAALITIDSTLKLGGIEMGLLSLYASIVQLTGYGVGFIAALLGGGKNLDKKLYN